MTRHQGSETGTLLGKLIAVQTGGFLVLALLLFILEEGGLPQVVVVALLVGFPVTIGVLIGLMARTTLSSVFLVTSRTMPVLVNSAAIAAAALSAGILAGRAGLIAESGVGPIFVDLGAVSGLVLAAILVSPHLRKSGARTLPEFLGLAYDSRLVRLLAAAVVAVILFALLFAEFTVAGHFVAGLTGVSFDAGVLAVCGLVIVATLPGGLRSATWTQAAQYAVIAAGTILPLAWLVWQRGGGVIPHVPDASLLEAVPAGFDQPGDGNDLAGGVPVVLGVMFGTAVLPHLIGRATTASGVNAARNAFLIAAVFVLVVLAAFPAYALVVRLDLASALTGQTVGTLAAVGDWVFLSAGTGGDALLNICGAPAGSAEAVIAACGGVNHVLAPSDLAFNPDLMLLALQDVSGMPYVFVGLLTAAIICAALSTATAVMATLSATIGEDFHHGLVDPNASNNRRMLFARLAILGVSAVAAQAAMLDWGGLASLAAGAVTLSAAALFPATIAVIWWRRTTGPAAALAMVAGAAFAIPALLAAATATPSMPVSLPVIGSLAAGGAGLVGAMIGLVILVAVSLMTAPPTQEVIRRRDEIARPAGRPVVEVGP